MAENKKRYKTAASREGGYKPKEIKFSDVGVDENELEPTPEQEESMVWRLVRMGAKLLILSVLLTVGALIYRAWTPQSLDDIAGYGEKGEVSQAVRNLPALLKRAQQSNQPLVLSERDINQYLAYAVKGRQGGPLSLLARYEGVAVRLHEGYAEVIMVRDIGDDQYKHTLSLYMMVSNMETYDGPSFVTEFARPDRIGSVTIGGRIGCLPVPQGYLALAQGSFDSLRKVLEPELEFILDPHRPIIIRHGEVEIMSSRRSSY